MINKNIAIAEAYYTAMNEKNSAEMSKYLHPNVQFSTPLAKLSGKEAVLDAATRFSTFFTKLTIRAQFGSEDQAMIAYDVEFPKPIGTVPTAVLMTFEDGLIAKYQLFYDARPFEEKREAIFKN